MHIFLLNHEGDTHMSVPYVIGQTLTPVAHYTQVLLFNSTTEFTHKLLLNLITHAKCARAHTHTSFTSIQQQTQIFSMWIYKGPSLITHSSWSTKIYTHTQDSPQSAKQHEFHKILHTSCSSTSRETTETSSHVALNLITNLLTNTRTHTHLTPQP